MKKPRIKLEVRNSFLLLLTALVWGVAFVAQRQGGASAGPYTFNCIRSFLGGFVLLPVIPFLDKVTGNQKRPTKEDLRADPVCGEHVSADGHVLRNHGGQGGVSDGVLYSSGAGAWYFFWEKMRLECLGQYFGGGRGALFFMSERQLFLAAL